MSSNHGRAGARESALVWLAGYDPGDNPAWGKIGEEMATDPSSMFTQAVVLDAFEAGVDHADRDYAIERSVGQGQLDAATSLMREAAELFRHYEAHHRAKVMPIGPPGPERNQATAESKAALEKAGRNALMAARLEAWLQGEGLYPITADGAYVAHARHGQVERHDFVRDQPGLDCGCEPFAIPAEVAADGSLVPVDTKTREDCRARFEAGSFEGYPGTTGRDAALRIAKRELERAFRITTADPRFDPLRPVTVNGYPYCPATRS
jgi:hypothetical protein